MANRNVFTDANVYINGASKFGQVNSVGSLTIKNTKIEIKDLGSIGTIKLPTGKIEAMEIKVNMNCIYPEVMSEIADPFESVDLKIYGNIMQYENDTVADNIGTKLFLRGTSAEFPLIGELKEHDNMNFEMTFDVNMARKVVNGKELYYIDIPNDIWMINGKDIRAQIRKNLGLS